MRSRGEPRSSWYSPKVRISTTTTVRRCDRHASCPPLPRKEESALAQCLQTQPRPPAECDRPPAKARAIAMPRRRSRPRSADGRTRRRYRPWPLKASRGASSRHELPSSRRRAGVSPPSAKRWHSSIGEEIGGRGLVPARTMRATVAECLLASQVRRSASTFVTAESAPASHPSSWQSPTPSSSASAAEGRRRRASRDWRGAAGWSAAAAGAPFVLVRVPWCGRSDNQARALGGAAGCRCRLARIRSPSTGCSAATFS